MASTVAIKMIRTNSPNLELHMYFWGVVEGKNRREAYELMQKVTCKQLRRATPDKDMYDELIKLSTDSISLEQLAEEVTRQIKHNIFSEHAWEYAYIFCSQVDDYSTLRRRLRRYEKSDRLNVRYWVPAEAGGYTEFSNELLSLVSSKLKNYKKQRCWSGEPPSEVDLLPVKYWDLLPPVYKETGH